jgi:o-succinylbenzoate---CoA ligase
VTASRASLRPVAGEPRDVAALLAPWLESAHPPALTVRTSGSTGEPKDVLLSASALRASALATSARLGGPGQWVLALPSHYVAGLQVLVRSYLAQTAPVVMADHRDLSAAVGSLRASRRYLACVPTQLHRWLSSDASTRALGELDAVLVGGAAVDERLLGAASDRGVPLVSTYGMTETCGGCVYDGVALDGVAVALGTGGEIRLRGPVLFDGYDGRADLTSQVLQDGWLHTPDLGRIDLDGRLTVTGRADDLVKSGGVTVPLGAVERRLTVMPGIDDVAVLAAPDAEWGSRVVAVLVAAHRPDLAAVRDFVGDVHPRAWAPREVRVVDRLPRLPSGKVDRQRLASMLAAAP